jgi:hypothetical protein
MTVDPVLSWVARLVLAAVFATAAASKLAEAGPFEGIVRNYRILPEPLVAPFARALPFVEAAAAVALLFEPARSAAAVVCAALLGAFALAMAINILRGRTEIDCGCFVGHSRQRIGWRLVLRNIVLLGVSALALATPGTRELLFADYVTIVAGTLTLALAYVSLSRMLELAPPTRREAA